MNHHVEFHPSGRGKAQCQTDPHYPNGIALDTSRNGLPSCTVALPYPAPECGLWIVRCKECAMSVAVTAAGRPDDPTSIKIECMQKFVQQPDELRAEVVN